MEIIDITISDEGEIQSIDWVAWIMNELETKGCTRADVAKTYAILIQKGHKDWALINEAIMKRWSKSALLWIKVQARKEIALASARVLRGV